MTDYPKVTPQDFIRKWKNIDLTERSAAQSHFIDLCSLLSEASPTDADPHGEWYAFEKGALKVGGGDGWADVWKKGHFAWEYKRKGGNLDSAYVQLQRYAIALEQPPLLIVADTQKIRIHTNWTNTVQQTFEISLEELIDDRRRRILKWAFSDPDQLKPGVTRKQLTEEAAKKFAALAQRLRDRGHDPHVVAHFVNRLVFCMFAEDVELLPREMFRRMLEASQKDNTLFTENARALFGAMKTGGRVGFEPVEWFNGGVFDDDSVLPLEGPDIDEVLDAAKLDWSNIDPSIMGTLFERGLDPGKRTQLGAHYTDAEKIRAIIQPVVIEPLVSEWQQLREKISDLTERSRQHKDKGQQTRLYNDALKIQRDFLDKLGKFRVFDPACGSGNFLYVALLALKDLEHRANLDSESLGLPRGFPAVGPECVAGIEINPYAVELARASIWIGEIQWMLRNGFDVSRTPVLKNLTNITRGDALMDEMANETIWPHCDALVGNPPFLGNKKLNRVLTRSYVTKLKDIYRSRVPTNADLVTYWFQKGAELVFSGRCKAVGLVGTQAIRRGASRKVLQNIVEHGRIFNAWSDEEWTVDGADVRVSIVCFSNEQDRPAFLNGKPAKTISPDLIESSEVARPQALAQNKGIAFQGTISGGPFEMRGEEVRVWLNAPQNPDGSYNREILRPWRNADDLTDRPSDTWVVFFPPGITEAKASMYEQPFVALRKAWDEENARLVKEGKPALRENEERSRLQWWLMQRGRPKFYKALERMDRYIATSRVSKYRTFTWLPSVVVPDTRIVAVARDDDTFFGMLHSKHHELWSLRYGGRHGVGNDPEYIHTQVFETFPFPEGFTPDISAQQYEANPVAQRISIAAKSLYNLRERWLNPPDIVEEIEEVVAGYPKRLKPRDDKAATILKERTITNLYNLRPPWLTEAHRNLDTAVAAAYGWPENQSDADILASLLELHRKRSGYSVASLVPS